jgi:glycosyltransferase involved in cell wall biosynthesis
LKNTPEHFVLIGNYPPDGQESMLRFADILAAGLRYRGLSAEIVAPRPVVAPPRSQPGGGLQKWLAYVDKWLVFPATLRRLVQQRERRFGGAVHYHVCDHSNAPYLARLPKNRTAITCHDVLAIRGALGYPESYCAASRTGVVLQRWILKHLAAAPRIACVSGQTLRHLCELAAEPKPKPDWKVLHNALNAEFKKVETPAALSRLEQQGVSLPRPFLLHVGSNLPRKNRRLLLQMLARDSRPEPAHVCFAGQPADATLLDEARTLGLGDRIHSVAKPSHETLCALYSLAHALVFPSLSEGFGWPVIEAQACGLPVIASDLAPLPEVSGGAALHADPHRPAAFVAALRSLDNPAVRNSLVERGLQNAGRFDLPTMINGYLALHGLNGAAKAPVALSPCC